MFYQLIKKLFYSNWLLCSLLTMAILAAMLFEFYPLQFLEFKAFDALARLRQQSDPAPIVVIEIDEQSIDQIGSWPWPRLTIADMIDQISEFNPKVIGLYVLYQDRGHYPGIEQLETIRESIRTDAFFEKNPKSRYRIDRILSNAQKDLDHDARLISSVNYAINMILPLRFEMGKPALIDTMKLPVPLLRNSLDAGMVLPPMQTVGADSKRLTIKRPGTDSFQAIDISPTYDQLAVKAGALGHVNVLPDFDGTVRRTSLLINYQNRFFPAFALQAATKYLGSSLADIKPGRTGLRLQNIDIPTDRSFEMLIDYKAIANNYKKVSFSEVQSDPQIAASFEGKIVLIGPTSSWLEPTFQTPTDQRLTGVEISAAVIGNILQRRSFSRPDWTSVLEILVLLYFGLFLMFVIPKVRPRDGGFILGIFITTWIGFVVVLIIVFGYWLKLVAPILLAILGYNITVIKRLADEKKNAATTLNKLLGQSFQEKGMLDMAFEKYAQCPADNDSVRELLFGLGQDFERKRLFNKALAVYQHMLKSVRSKEIEQRIRRLKNLGETVILGPTSGKTEAALLLDDDTTKPTLGRYEIIEELGQGSMGTVYLGRDPKINREVAIKTLSYSDVEEDQLTVIKERFFREAEAAGKLAHPNIVTIYDVGEDYGLAYMAMELLKGSDLSQYCQKDTLLPLTKALSVAAKVAEALEYAHNHGVVHRDIKPDNIILLENEQVKVADFGIARVVTGSKTQTGLIMGTPNYMSPEQVAGEQVDGRSDLFSLGVVFYELLSGERPFKGDNLTHLMYAISNVSYLPLRKILPDTPSCCNRIVDRLLTKRPDDRIASAAEARQMILACVDKTAVS